MNWTVLSYWVEIRFEVKEHGWKTLVRSKQEQVSHSEIILMSSSKLYEGGIRWRKEWGKSDFRELILAFCKK